jgi:integrase
MLKHLPNVPHDGHGGAVHQRDPRLQWGDFNVGTGSAQRCWRQVRRGEDGVFERLRSARSTSDDWVFANPRHGQESLRKRQLLKVAKLIGLDEGIGWHTFCHTYGSWLDETAAPMKVQQELMRHASIQTTMNVYGRAMTDSKRKANSQVVGRVFGESLHAREEGESAVVLQEQHR